MKDIAIIGMSCRFPKSENYLSYWNNILEKRNMISYFSDDELAACGIDRTILSNTNYVKAKGIIANSEYFDLDLLNETEKNIRSMDPQQRIAIECSWEALENAGYLSSNRSIGVFIAGNVSTYYLNYLQNGDNATKLQVLLNNGGDYLATKISYFLDLRGPSKTIQTACSSSLVCIHDACLSLLNCECDIAIAGGVAISFPTKEGYFYAPESILSPDGECRVFDINSHGTVFSDGVGIVVLKPLKTALEDRDTIYAVIKGSAINNDGQRKSTYTSPSAQGQAEVIALAYDDADINPETVSYIEAHGTGTAIGDPIEIKALSEAFSIFTSKKQYCAIGSVKANIGHLSAAAGVAGFIKTVLILKNKTIPPQINFEKQSPYIDFENSPFFITDRVVPLPNSIVRAGVSSFGIGGTNAHIVLESAPEESSSIRPNKIGEFEKHNVMVLSANSQESLNEMVKHMQIYIQNHLEKLRDIAYTLQVGRMQLPYRCLVRLNEIRIPEKYKVVDCRLNKPTQVGIVFNGNGNNTGDYVKILRKVYEANSVLKKIIDEVVVELPVEYISLILEKNMKNGAGFIINVAIVRLLNKLINNLDFVSGSGFGLFVAAHVSGRISLQEAFDLSCMLDSIEGSTSDIFSDFSVMNNSSSTLKLLSFKYNRVVDAELYVEDLDKSVGSNTQGGVVISISRKREDLNEFLYLDCEQSANDFWKSIMDIISKVWLSGVNINWDCLYENDSEVGRIHLPTYCFNRKNLQQQVNINNNLEKTRQANNELGTIEKIVNLIWRETFELEEVEPNDDIFSLGVDSLGCLDMLEKIKLLFGISVGLAEVNNHPDLKSFSKYVENQIKKRSQLG